MYFPGLISEKCVGVRKEDTCSLAPICCIHGILAISAYLCHGVSSYDFIRSTVFLIFSN